MEKISTVGRLKHIKVEHFGQKNEDIEKMVKRGNGVDGEKFIEFYKQINKDKVSKSYSRQMIFKISFSKLHQLLIYYLAQKSSLEKTAVSKWNEKICNSEEGGTGKKFHKM